MVSYYGDFAEDDTVLIPFNTFDSNDPSASVTITNLADADLKVHKDGSTTEATTDGATVVINFDGITGNHLVTIDTSADAFYVTGSEYSVRMEGTTIDGGTINAWIGSFSIERAGGVLALVKAGVTLAAGAVNDASLAGGLEIVFETDFATNYNTTRNAWATNVQDQVGTGNLTADLIAISGDTTAANNLELMYDGTGYTDPTGPSSRAQVDGTTASAGGSVNIAASEDNTAGAIDPGSTTKVWATVSGTFANTEAINGTQHDFTDTGDDISHVYGFQVGGGRTATAIDIIANVDGNTDEMQIEVWDHVGGDWEVIGTIDGSGGTSYVAVEAALLLKHTGTAGAEIGKVYIQLDTNSTTPSDLSVEQILVSAVNIGQTAGYQNGAIWVDTNDGTTGTESFVNGTSDNPCKTWADAQTIALALNMHDFHIINGTTITLDTAITNYSLFGDNWTLDLNTRAIVGCHFEGTIVSGISSGIGASFFGSKINNVTIAGPFSLERCVLAGIITLDATESEFEHCTMGGTPVLEFGNAVGNTIIHMHGYNGAITLSSMGDTGTDVLHIDGAGTMTTDACAGGTVHYRGEFKITDSGGNTTFNASDQRVDVAAILTDTTDIQPNYATEAKQDIIDTNVDDLKLGIIFGVAETGTLSTTAATTDLTGFTDDQLIGRTIIFLAGPADGEGATISDYASASGLITFTGTPLTLAPENGNAFKIV